MKNLFKISAYFLLVLGFIGCGGSGSDSGDSSSSLSVNTSQKVDLNSTKMGINTQCH